MAKDKVKDDKATPQQHRLKLGDQPTPAKFGKSMRTKNISVTQKRTGKRGRG